MAKLSLGDRSSKSRPVSPPSQGSNPAYVDDIFSTEAIASTSNLAFPNASSGGEIGRIRLQMLEDGMAHFQETESRRPEYLKRTKRSLLDSDPTVDPVLDLEERESVLPGVGITVSPMKGRRLKLFQETSEESFEESLMAGGYERYVSHTSSDYHGVRPFDLCVHSVMRIGCNSLLQALVAWHFHLSKLSPCLARRS
jgi:hypothetical protein